MLNKLLLAGVAAGLTLANVAGAQETVKIGLITTLSGPAGYIGSDMRDSFLLAVEMEGGKLGGVPVAVTVEDDGLKPGQGKQIAEKFLKTDKMKIITGIIFSNVAGAVVPDVVDDGAFYISPNAAPSNFAGKECNKNYFVIPWQNDSLHESAGQLATNLGYKTAVILGANYQAGKDALTGFKRLFKGKILEEIYTKLDQTDFAAEMAQIRNAKPDVVYQFHPGGQGITFLKQYGQAGLLNTVPMVGAEPSMDAVIMKALGNDAIGFNVTSHWNSDFDNAANKKFMEAYTKKFNKTPTYYGAMGYDTAQAIGAALKGAKGIGNLDAFRTEMKKANFESVRGKFKFDVNNHPIQDWYALKVEKGADGAPYLKTVSKVLEQVGDVYAKDCKL